jgi:hypothetical protein
VRQFISKQKRGVENALLRKDSGITKREGYITSIQKLRMYLFFPYAFTLILPLLQSVVNAILEKQIMWLAHWYMTIFSAIVLSLTIGSIFLRKALKIA